MLSVWNASEWLHTPEIDTPTSPFGPGLPKLWSAHDLTAPSIEPPYQKLSRCSGFLHLAALVVLFAQCLNLGCGCATTTKNPHSDMRDYRLVYRILTFSRSCFTMKTLCLQNFCHSGPCGWHIHVKHITISTLHPTCLSEYYLGSRLEHRRCCSLVPLSSSPRIPV